MKKTAPQDTPARSRLIIGENGPSDSALAASSGRRLIAAQPLTGTLRAALLGRSLKKSADCSAIPLRSEPPEVICPARLEGEGSRGQQSEVRAARLTAQRRRDAG